MMNKFFCLLTGGHKYEDKNLRTSYNIKRSVYEMRNYCCKCGKEYFVEIPDEIIIAKIDRFIEDCDRAEKEIWR